jgi:hypothetical protein
MKTFAENNKKMLKKKRTLCFESFGWQGAFDL